MRVLSKDMARTRNNLKLEAATQLGEEEGQILNCSCKALCQYSLVTVDLTRKDRREWHDFQEDVTGKTEGHY